MADTERSPKRRKINDTENEVYAGLCSGSIWKDYQAEEKEEEFEQPFEEGIGVAPSSKSHTQNGDTPNSILKDAHQEEDDLPGAVDAEPPLTPDPPLSKSQQKKLRRKAEWAAAREDRKAWKKEKRKVKQARKRAARDKESKEPLQDATNGQAAQASSELQKQAQPKRRRPVQLPITFIFDCGFDDLMLDKERVSLSSQLTRCYSNNFKAKFRYHLAIASFGGELKKRFDTVLSKHYQSWKGVRIFDEDFFSVAEKSEGWLAEDQEGKLAGAFERRPGSAADGGENEPDTESTLAESKNAETIYLTSDSPNTLIELKPYGTYIIGGLVDRNRHKGVCYKRACDRGVKTAKLPIGEYMEMASRFVLATNHVAEIMLLWLEYRDWGKAFLEVVPKRKGGVLRETGKDAEREGEDVGGAIEADGEEDDGMEDVQDEGSRDQDGEDGNQEEDDGKAKEAVEKATP